MKKILLKNANLYNGTKDMRLQENVSILVNGNVIENIGNIEESKDYKVIDLKGKYVIPGLINMHVHIPGSGKMSATSGSSKKLVKTLVENKWLNFVGIALGAKYVKEELLCGVTTLRAVGGIYNFDGRLKDQINNGKKVGPRIFAANYAIAPKDGHMVGTVSYVADSVEEAIKMVEELVNVHHSDLIKLMITGGVLDATKKGEPGVLKMKPEIVKACCDKAHELNVKVAAHVESYEGARVALENGVDTIEHGVKFDDELISLLKEKNAHVVTTISPALPICFDETFSEFVRYNSFVVLKNIIDGANSLLEKGIDVGLGTDTGCPYTTHYNFYRELVYASKYLNTSKENILYMATLGNAKILGQDDKIGSVEVGKYADMVVVDNDPISDFHNLSIPTFVIKDGKIYTKKNKKYKKVEEYLNSLDYKDIDSSFAKLDN